MEVDQAHHPEDIDVEDLDNQIVEDLPESKLDEDNLSNRSIGKQSS